MPRIYEKTNNHLFFFFKNITCTWQRLPQACGTEGKYIIYDQLPFSQDINVLAKIATSPSFLFALEKFIIDENITKYEWLSMVLHRFWMLNQHLYVKTLVGNI